MSGTWDGRKRRISYPLNEKNDWRMKMEKTIEGVKALFPEAEQISDSKLREKVLETWLEAWKLSGVARLEQTPFLEGALTEINNVEHTRAVTVLCIQFANVIRLFLNIEVNMDYLIAGAMLHDIGKVFEYREDKENLGRLFSHSISAAILASKQDLPLEVIHIIAMHAMEGDLIKRTPESVIVHFMDFAYADFVLRSKTPLNLEELIKVKNIKRALRFIDV